MLKRVKNDFKTLNGEIVIPPDKSISHRAVILASLAKGKSTIKNFSDGKDPKSTLNIFKNLGVDIDILEKSTIAINSNSKLLPPAQNLDCGNSGTSMRLIAGVLARQNFNSILIGDQSLSKRPMKRIIEPLTMMGANIESKEGKAPLKIYGEKLHAITYKIPKSSAQVKSCILLAGLGADDGKTIITEHSLSRNHTEIMLQYMGANIEITGNTVSIEKSELAPIDIEICGDISSAAYFIAAALLIPNSNITLKNVGLNPTRTGMIDILAKMGANIKIFDEQEICGEKVGTLQVKYSQLKSCEISGEIIPRLIDEIPILAILATQAEGQTIIKDSQDLRNKESDRITTVVTELKKLGADIEETPDGMLINGKTPLIGDSEIETYHDHRLAMSLYVAGLICQKEILIKNFQWVNISFPTFEKLFETLKKQ